MARPMRPARSKRLQQEIAKIQFERLLGNTAQLSLIAIGAMTLLVALHLGQVVLAPVFLAITVGLMFGPVADALERRGIPDGVSAAVVVVTFLALIAVSIVLFAGPVSEWVQRLPIIWAALQRELANWQQPLASISAMQEQVQSALGQDPSKLQVTVEEGNPLQDIAMHAPVFVAEVLVFLASLYFFLATRDQIRIFALSLCVTRRMRWRMAHVFRDVEEKVSKFLLTVTVLNFGMGAGVAILMALAGMPTPVLWGALAALLNFVPFVGQAVMVSLLFAVGLSTQSGLQGALIPVGLYLAINFVEGNFVTPHMLGRTLTMNPFVILIAITYWLWAWGPVGGFIAVPSLLIIYSIASNILPIGNVPLRQLVREREERAAEQSRLAAQEAAPSPDAASVEQSGQPSPAREHATAAAR